MTNNVIYQATVKSENSNVEENYLGLTGDPFKLRYGNHKKSFNHENYSTESTLSAHIWKLKRENVDYDISWKIIDRDKTFSPIRNLCQLCTKEKYHIIFSPEICSINNCDELKAPCRHKRKFLLQNI